MTAHYGNFALACCVLGLAKVRAFAITKKIGVQLARDLWFGALERCGVGTIPTRKSSPAIHEHLSAGNVVIFTNDQHMPHFRGIATTFLGRLASTSSAPVRFAAELGAPIVMARTYRDGKNHVVEFEAPVSLPRNIDERLETQKLNDRMAMWIREKPSMWLWHHRRWKISREPSLWEIPIDLQKLIEN